MADPFLPNVWTTEEAAKQVEAATAWAHRMLGSPNALREDLQRWMLPGETCMEGIERANTEVERLRSRVRGEEMIGEQTAE